MVYPTITGWSPRSSSLIPEIQVFEYTIFISVNIRFDMCDAFAFTGGSILTAGMSVKRQYGGCPHKDIAKERLMRLFFLHLFGLLSLRARRGQIFLEMLQVEE